jgi:hypothetical protein
VDPDRQVRTLQEAGASTADAICRLEELLLHQQVHGLRQSEALRICQLEEAVRDQQVHALEKAGASTTEVICRLQELLLEEAVRDQQARTLQEAEASTTPRP